MEYPVVSAAGAPNGGLASSDSAGGGTGGTDVQMMELTMKYLLNIMAAVLMALAGTAVAQTPPTTYQAAAKYQFGQSRKDLAAIEAEIRSAKPEQYPAIEAKLLDLLKSRETTIDAKRYLCRYLAIVGSAQSIPALSALLGDEQLSNSARIALEPMPDPAAGASLRQALTHVKGKLLAGVIGSLGVRRDNEAVAALAELINSDNADVSTAAIAALGVIGSDESAKALQTASAKAAEPLRITIAKALINCADRLAHAGAVSQAGPIYRSIAEGKYPDAQRIAGTVGMTALSDPIEAAATTIVMLNEDEPALRLAGVIAFKTLGDKGIQDMVIQRLHTLKPISQLAVLQVLSDLPKLPARESILRALKNGPEDIQLAALNCLIVHGDSADVPMLAQLAATGSPAQKLAALNVLSRLGKAGTDAAIITLIGSDDAALRDVAISATAARHITGALPQLTRLSQGEDAKAAAQALDAIGALGGADQLPTLVALLLKSTDEGVRKSAETAASDICIRIGDSKVTGPIVLGAYAKATTNSARIALMHLLPRVKSDAALAAVKQATANADAEIREEGIRTLADWPELSAADLLFDLADKADSDRLAIIALQGCIRLAGQKTHPIPERLAIYQKVITSAKRIEEKRQAIAGMGDLANIRAMEELVKYATTDPTLLNDAARAAVRVAGLRGVNQKQQVLAALEKLKAQPLSPAVMRQVDSAIARQTRPAR